MNYIKTLVNKCSSKYRNKELYYGDICSEITTILSHDCDSLMEIEDYNHNYTPLLNTLEAFKAVIENNISRYNEDDLQRSLINNSYEWCKSKINVCKMVMRRINETTLGDIFIHYCQLYTLETNPYNNIFDGIKLTKKIKENLMNTTKILYNRQQFIIKQLINNKEAYYELLGERLNGRNINNIEIIDYLNKLNPGYLIKLINQGTTNIDDTLNEFLVSLSRPFDDLILGKEDEDNTILGMKQNQLYLYNNGEHEYNEIVETKRGIIYKYMKPLYPSQEPIKLIKHFIKTVLTKQVTINGMIYRCYMIA